MTPIRFNDALRIAAFAAHEATLSGPKPVRIIRDVYGRVRFAVNCDSADYPEATRQALEAVQTALGVYAGDNVLFRDDFSNPDAIFNSADWHDTTVPGVLGEAGALAPDVTISVLDRQITGQDWLKPTPSETAHPHRLVFYGLKGGVGRSTALAMVAHGLARQGKRVLLIDFDLESPGLSGLLLPPEHVAEFGLVDWFVEDAVGQGDGVLRSMVSTSPLADTTTGRIRVAAAMGRTETAYLAKLARAYADIPGTDGPQRFGARMQRIVELLEAQEKPDVVLIDSRAGLHDVAAVAITSLADTALLFATDSAQNWLGYRQLFMHWEHHPDVCARVRERLAIVRALTPQGNREAQVRAFQEHSYELFADTLYDEISPSFNAEVDAEQDEPEPFHPAMEDESAPHFPILIDWDTRFQEFDPTLRPENGGVGDAQIDATFGALIDWTMARISGGAK